MGHTRIEMEAMQAQIDMARSLKRIARALENVQIVTVRMPENSGPVNTHEPGCGGCAC